MHSQLPYFFRRCHYCDMFGKKTQNKNPQLLKCTCNKNKKKQKSNQISKHKNIHNLNHSVIQFNLFKQNQLLRKQITQLTKQLGKASGQISYLTQASSRNRQQNGFKYATTFKSHSQFDKCETLELQDKLYKSNKNLQDSLIKLNQISKRNKCLQNSLESYQRQNLRLKERIQELSENQNRIIRDRQKERQLQLKLQDTVNYNTDLFQKYKKVLQQNSQLQVICVQLEQQISNLHDQLGLSKSHITAIKKAQHKVQNLQKSLMYFEDNNLTVNQIERKLLHIKQDFNHKIQVLQNCNQFVNNQFNSLNETMNLCLAKMGLKSKSYFRQINFKQLFHVADLTKNIGLKRLIERMNFGPFIQNFLEGFMCIVQKLISESYFKISSKIGEYQRKQQGLKKTLFKLKKTRRIKVQ